MISDSNNEEAAAAIKPLNEEVGEQKDPIAPKSFKFANFLEAQKMIRGDLRHVMLDFEE